MKIVILDGAATTGDDLDWSGLQALGEVTAYAYTEEEDLVARAVGAAAILTNKTPLRADTLAQLPALRYIGLLATGYDIVDVAAARNRGIPVCNAASYGTESVAQHVFAMILTLCNRIQQHHDAVQAGEWQRQASWTFRLAPLLELRGLTMGIIGLGAIGQATARIAQGFGMEVLAHNRSPRNLPGVTMASTPEEVFAAADFVSLHCPLNHETNDMVNRGLLTRMKPTAYLINTARGGLIKESALKEALERGTLAGAALDVLSSEPPPQDHPLLGLPNCLLTPHNAWGSRAARSRLIAQVTDNLAAFLDGHPQQVVNGPL